MNFQAYFLGLIDPFNAKYRGYAKNSKNISLLYSLINIHVPEAESGGPSLLFLVFNRKIIFINTHCKFP